eukprot:1608986-Pleurochrysis_carterae.AAC.1
MRVEGCFKELHALGGVADCGRRLRIGRRLRGARNEPQVVIWRAPGLTLGGNGKSGRGAILCCFRGELVLSRAVWILPAESAAGKESVAVKRFEE